MNTSSESHTEALFII